MSDFHASLECNNLYFYVSEYANLADKFVGRNYHYMQLQMMENCLRQLDMLEDLKRQASLKYQIKIHIKRYLHIK